VSECINPVHELWDIPWALGDGSDEVEILQYAEWTLNDFVRLCIPLSAPLLTPHLKSLGLGNMNVVASPSHVYWAISISTTLHEYPVL
jgi:hypothetical protein